MLALAEPLIAMWLITGEWMMDLVAVATDYQFTIVKPRERFTARILWPLLAAGFAPEIVGYSILVVLGFFIDSIRSLNRSNLNHFS